MSDAAERLPPHVIRALNKTLAPLGLRICSKHQGHVLPLDSDHFYQRGDGRFAHECIPCFRARSAANGRARYASDPDYRARKLGSGRVVKSGYLERKRRSARDYKRRCKARLFACVLAQVQP